jgi:hypothetical protein
MLLRNYVLERLNRAPGAVVSRDISLADTTTLHEWAAVEGALICVGVGLLALAILLIVIQHWRESRNWRRLVKACGGHEVAIGLVKAAEATAVAATDVIAGIGFRSAARRRWLPEDVQ